MTQQQPRRGVYAAVLTPVDDKLEPNAKAYVAHCRWLLANGCDGLAPLGTTGEANSLSVAQRLISVLERTDKGMRLDYVLDIPASLRLAVTGEDLRAGFSLTGHFLDARVLRPRDMQMPDARARLLSYLGRNSGV